MAVTLDHRRFSCCGLLLSLSLGLNACGLWSNSSPVDSTPTRQDSPASVLKSAELNGLALPELDESFEAEDDFIAADTAPPPEIEPPQASSAVSDDLLRMMVARFALDANRDHPEVAKWIKWYQRHPLHLSSVMRNGERYMAWIYKEISERGLPAELVLLPAVESGFDPWAESPSGAAGPWQFTKSTGDYLGLRRDYWGDERRDIVRSTHAALKYLDYLKARFNDDWLLALAAYNTGEGNVSKALRRARKAGKSESYWDLPLAEETQAYIPKLLAMAEVIRNPGKYDLALWPIGTEPYFTRVRLNGPADLAKVADLAEVSVEEIHRLNPALDRWMTRATGIADDEHGVYVPARRRSLFASPRRRGGNELLLTKLHTVKAGDSISELAEKYSLPAKWLNNFNSLSDNRLAIGQQLAVPQPSLPANEYLLSAEQRQHRWGKRRFYTVKPGDSLWLIARKHDVTVRKLQAWNHLGRQSKIMPGTRLALYDRRSAKNANDPSPGYRMKPGDTLSEVAERFGLKTSDLIAWNRISDVRLLRPGRAIKLWPPEQEANGRKGLLYTVVSGDSLGHIGERMGVKVAELCRWNDINRDAVLKPGQQLMLFSEQQKGGGNDSRRTSAPAI